MSKYELILFWSEEDQAFIAEEQSYKQIADLAAAVLEQRPLTSASAQALSTLLAESDIKAAVAVLQQTDSSDDDIEQAKQQLLNQLLDRHGTGRILFRNSRSAISGFPQRQPQAVALELPEQYKNALKVQQAFNKQQSLEQKAKASLFPERVFQEFEGKASSWWQFDPRVELIIDRIKANKYKKFLIICAHADTGRGGTGSGAGRTWRGGGRRMMVGRTQERCTCMRG